MVGLRRRWVGAEKQGKVARDLGLGRILPSNLRTVELMVDTPTQCSIALGSGALLDISGAHPEEKLFARLKFS